MIMFFIFQKKWKNVLSSFAGIRLHDLDGI